MADIRVKSQSFPEISGSTAKTISLIKKWAIETKRFDKEMATLPRGVECVIELKYAPWDPNTPIIRCEFPTGQDCFILRSRTYVGEKHKLLVTKNTPLRRQFIGKIVKYGALAGLHYNYYLGGDPPFSWDFYDEIYYNGLTKDEFFRRFRKVGGIADYFYDVFRNIFFKQGQDLIVRDAMTNLYI